MGRHRIKHTKPTFADKTRKDFYELILDWIHLHNHLPKPAKTSQQTRHGTREYGHPSQWASDKAALIADILTSWHDMLADYRGETRPPNRLTHGTNSYHTTIIAQPSQLIRITQAWRYIEPRIEQLCELVEPEAFREIRDLHHGIQRTLGQNNPKIILPFPCPAPECGLKTLQRDILVGQNGHIICGSCGYTQREENYQFMIGVILDTLIAAA